MVKLKKICNAQRRFFLVILLGNFDTYRSLDKHLTGTSQILTLATSVIQGYSQHNNSFFIQKGP